MECDVIVIGAGPAGLAVARRVAGSDLRIVLVERQPRAVLVDPLPDGRAIALTHRSIDMLRALGAWQAIDPAAISLLRAAKVINGASSFALSFDTEGLHSDYLGKLVSNHLLRRALFASIEEQPNLTVLAGIGAGAIATGPAGASVTLSDGRMLHGRLLVGADSRFSEVRARLGIAAQVKRLGRSMLLADVEHEGTHEGIATEWFGHGQTVAMLPLAGRRSSVVLTLPEDAIARLRLSGAEALSTELTRRTAGQLGGMRIVAGPYVYPLATTWSAHFVAMRAALVGDAAVGMHPVTAHGFNLGLRSAVSLGDMILRAARKDRDIGSPRLLRRYEMEHRAVAAPMFAATSMLVNVFNDDSTAGQVVRPALLRVAAGLAPVRTGMARMLMQR